MAPTVGTPVQLALPRLLQLGEGIRGRILERVRRNLAHLRAALSAQSPVSIPNIEAGWSAIVRVPEVKSDEEWCLELLTEEGVLVQPGYFFDLPWGAALVLSLLPEPAIFDEGLRRLLAHVEVQ